ncbi:uncharacterized protein [Anabrus simplex]|uniref:uncharacterized protein n=1 Tax=Anabrus simplex TaxID=316456 RepID=UPI0034DD4A38
MLVLKTSGCGLTLKTGTIIIGVLQALGGFSVMISESVSAYRSDRTAIISGPDHGISKEEEENVKRYVQGHKELCIVLAIAGGIQLILSILLLYGADYESPKLVKPWVIFSMIMTGVMVATYFGLGIVTLVLGFDKVGASILIGIVLASAISFYFILVVHSFYRYLIELKSPIII